MATGYVDRVTRESIAGWAADPSRPDDSVDIVVIANGRKMAQVTCDAYRPDLERLGQYGNGRHGFRYEFPAPFTIGQEVRIGVRFAESGRPVANGDVLLPAGATASVPAAAPRPFVAPAPRDPRALFRLFGLYEREWGIYELLCRLDFTDIRPGHLDYCVFGDAAAPSPQSGWNPQAARDHLYAHLQSSRFQEDILALVLRAFPEKRRVLFIHIPKCAGTDLLAHLSLRYPLVRQHWREQSWTDREGLFAAIADFMREVPFADEIMVGGHVPLDYYTGAGLIRPIDRVLTVVRDPMEIAISAINYTLSRFQANIGLEHVEPDVSGWLSALNIPALPSQMTPQFIADIAHRALYNAEIVPANPLPDYP